MILLDTHAISYADIAVRPIHPEESQAYDVCRRRVEGMLQPHTRMDAIGHYCHVTLSFPMTCQSPPCSRPQCPRHERLCSLRFTSNRSNSIPGAILVLKVLHEEKLSTSSLKKIIKNTSFVAGGKPTKSRFMKRILPSDIFQSFFSVTFHFQTSNCPNRPLSSVHTGNSKSLIVVQPLHPLFCR